MREFCAVSLDNKRKPYFLRVQNSFIHISNNLVFNNRHAIIIQQFFRFSLRHGQPPLCSHPLDQSGCAYHCHFFFPLLFIVIASAINVSAK